MPVRTCLALIIFAACVPEPKLDEAKCPFSLHESLQKNVHYRCGFIDRGFGVKVAALLFKTSKGGGSTPLLYIAGGPSQSWENLGLDAVTADDLAVGARDLLFVEQRGTGVSVPLLECTENDNTRDCYDRLRGKGVNVLAYNTLEIADDVNAVRQAYGYPTVLLNATSYGTTVARAVMDRYPKTIERVLLDSATAATTDSISTYASNVDRAFTSLFAACAADPACRAFAPNLEQTLLDTMTKLRDAPLKNAAGEEALGEVGFFFTTFALLSSFPLDVPAFVMAVAAAVPSGRLPAELEETASGLTPSKKAPETFGQFLSVYCGDNPDVTAEAIAADAANVRPELAELLKAVTLNLHELCDAWPHVDARFTNTKYKGPVLILSGALDPRTPPTDAENAASVLPGAEIVTVPYGGHSLQAIDGCVVSLVRRFYADGTVDDACLRAAPVKFHVPSAREPKKFAFKRRYSLREMLGLAR